MVVLKTWEFENVRYKIDNTLIILQEEWKRNPNQSHKNKHMQGKGIMYVMFNCDGFKIDIFLVIDLKLFISEYI